MADPSAPAADDPCQCPWTDPAGWFTYYGAVEPGGTRDQSPDCPLHGTAGVEPAWPPLQPIPAVTVDGEDLPVSAVGPAGGQ